MTDNTINAPKFMIRFATTEQRDAVHAKSAEQHISINAFVLQAIDEKLQRGAALDAVIELARQKLTVNA
ncbi:MULTISPECIES: hypothetical protein [unclassified Pseudomonas]|uniref:hypothetical protein n=1 Tax=unclassified Pseudomonas TaxID=196821 RepID=UPI001F5A20A7|nr:MULTISPECIES: hypothetical protein [unclassified Pseudomonas]